MGDSIIVTQRLIGPLVFFALLMVVLALVGKVPLSYNVRNLLVRWPISVLTALVFIVVVALMTGMLAFVNGMYQLTKVSGVPGNVMVMSDGATDELFSNLGYKDIDNLANWPTVLRDAGGRPLVSKETYLVVNQPIPGAVKGGRQRRFLQVRGLDDPAASGQVHNLPLHEGGTWFSEAGVTRREVNGQTDSLGFVEAVLGEGIARELGHDVGKKTLAIDDIFEVGPRYWIVTGILQSAGSTFDSEIWTKRQQAGELFGKNTVTTLVMRTADIDTAQATAKDVTANFKDAAVQAQAETDYYEKLNTTNQQFLYAISFVAVILGIGGVFGVMNAMFAAISQRIKDIGVLRIIGFARWQILVSFFLETLVLALVGGVIGCAIGRLANGLTATSIISSGAGGGGKSVVFKLIVDGNILLTGMLISLGMGCAGGLFPALSAMRLKPLDAVR